MSYPVDLAPQNTSESDIDLVERANYLAKRYAERDEFLDTLSDKYFHVESLTVNDDNVYQVTVTEAKNAIRLISDLLASQDVTVSMAATKDSEKARREADEREAWLTAWLEQVSHEEDVNLVRELAEDVCTRGAAVLRVIMLEERVDEEDEGLPIIYEVRDWRNVYPVYRRSRLTEVFECYEVDVFDLREDYPELDLPENWKYGDLVTVWEWWSEEDKAFWVIGKKYNYYQQSAAANRGIVWLMHPTPHGFGGLPYSVRLLRGQSKKRNNPNKMAPSMLEDWKPILDVLNLLTSAELSTIMQYSNAAWAVYTTDMNFELDLMPGAVNYLRPQEGEEVHAIVRGEVPLDLQAAANKWSQRFQQASIPAALYGEIPGSMAGYAIALLNESGRRILVPVIQAVESIIADTMGNCLMIAEHLAGPTIGGPLVVSVDQDDKKRKGGKLRRGVELDWETINGNHQVAVGLGDPMPQDEERGMGMATAARQLNKDGTPLLSDETIRDKYLHVNDESSERQKILRQGFISLLAGQVAQDIAIEAGLIPEQQPAPGGVSPEAMPVGAQAPPEAMPVGAPAQMGGAEPPQMQEVIDAVLQLASRVSQIEQLLASLGGGQPPPGGGMPPGEMPPPGGGMPAGGMPPGGGMPPPGMEGIPGPIPPEVMP